MSDINGAIRVGFYQRLTTDNPFKTAITTVNGTKLFYGRAPQIYPGTSVNLDLPYVVFNTLPITTGRDTVNQFPEAVIQFNIAAETVGECENLANLLSNELEDQESTLNFTGYSTIRILEEPRIDQGIIDNVWNFTLQYVLTLQEQ